MGVKVLEGMKAALAWSGKYWDLELLKEHQEDKMSAKPVERPHGKKPLECPHYLRSGLC